MDVNGDCFPRPEREMAIDDQVVPDACHIDFVDVLFVVDVVWIDGHANPVVCGLKKGTASILA